MRTKRRPFLIKQGCRVLDPRGRASVYRGFVRPLVENCPTVWIGPAPSHLGRPDSIQQKAKRLAGRCCRVFTAVEMSRRCAFYTGCIMQMRQLPSVISILPATRCSVPAFAHVQQTGFRSTHVRFAISESQIVSTTRCDPSTSELFSTGTACLPRFSQLSLIVKAFQLSAVQPNQFLSSFTPVTLNIDCLLLRVVGLL